MGTRSYAVIGMGGVGGFYGAKLAAAGHDVHFLVRSGVDEVRKGGLRVESPEGDLFLPEVSVSDSADELPPVDVVVVAVKTTDTDGVLPAVRTLAATGATVVAMQNGLGVEARLAGAAPDATVLGAMCFICSNRAAPGHIRHLDYGRVTVGEHADAAEPVGVTPAVTALVDQCLPKERGRRFWHKLRDLRARAKERRRLKREAKRAAKEELRG